MRHAAGTSGLSRRREILDGRRLGIRSGAIAYLTGFVIVVSAAVLAGRSGRADLTLAVVVRGVLLEVAVSLVEVGYVLAYQRGLPVGTGPVMVLAITTIALIPIGLFVFNDYRTLAGVLLALSGMWVMRR